MADIIRVSPTRSELIKIRHRTKLAKKGYSLLKKKQDVLTKEFLDIVEEYKEYKKDLLSKLKATYRSLSFDIAYAGINVSRSVAYATREQFDINYTTKNIMGIRLPSIEAVKNDANGQSFGNSPLLANATNKFHDLFRHLIKLSGMELTIRALSEEIKKTRRRVKSLEHIQIPKLENTEKHILFVLDEQERDNFIRLKTIKKRMEEEAS